MGVDCPAQRSRRHFVCLSAWQFAPLFSCLFSVIRSPSPSFLCPCFYCDVRNRFKRADDDFGDDYREGKRAATDAADDRPCQRALDNDIDDIDDIDDDGCSAAHAGDRDDIDCNYGHLALDDDDDDDKSASRYSLFDNCQDGDVTSRHLDDY